MDKHIAFVIGFDGVGLISMWISKNEEGEGMGASEHSEISRLRGDVRGVRNVLILTNAMLAAIVAVLVI